MGAGHGLVQGDADAVAAAVGAALGLRLGTGALRHALAGFAWAAAAGGAAPPPRPQGRRLPPGPRPLLRCEIGTGAPGAMVVVPGGWSGDVDVNRVDEAPGGRGRGGGLLALPAARRLAERQRAPMPPMPAWLAGAWCALAHRRARRRFPRYLDGGRVYCARCRRWWD